MAGGWWLVGADGRARVADFGLARFSPTSAAALGDAEGARLRTTASTAAAGTPAYMAPEVVGGAPASFASDQYSLCVTLYEALYGVRPDAGGAPTGATPPAVRRVLARGLQQDPQARHPSVRALAEELHKTLRRRRPLLWGPAGASLVGLGIAGGMWGAPAPVEATDPVEDVEMVAASASASEVVQTNPIRAIETLADALEDADPRALSEESFLQTQAWNVVEQAEVLGLPDVVLEHAPRDWPTLCPGLTLIAKRGESTFSALPADFERPVPKPVGVPYGESHRASCHALSPDLRWYVARSDRGDVETNETQLISLHGESPIVLGHVLRSWAFSREGRYFAYGTTLGQVELFDMRTRTQQRVAELSEKPDGSPPGFTPIAVADDGAHVAFVREGSLLVQSTRDGSSWLLEDRDAPWLTFVPGATSLLFMESGRVWEWDWSVDTVVPLSSEQRKVAWAKISPDGRWVVSQSEGTVPSRLRRAKRTLAEHLGERDSAGCDKRSGCEPTSEGHRLVLDVSARSRGGARFFADWAR